MEHRRETLSIQTQDDHPVWADVYRPSGETRAVVVLCHGFKGHRRWGFFPYLGERLSAAGICALAIDYSYNGTAGGASEGELYAAPELFEANTLRRELDDLRRVVAFVAEGGLGAPAPVIGLMGHSRGAVSSILLAIERDEIGALVSWSSTDDPDFYTDKQKQVWRRAGRFAFTEAVERARLAIGIDYLNDLEQNHAFYLLRDRVKTLQTPHLLVHGELDIVIDANGSRALYAAETSSAAKKLVGLKTGHTFGVPYPPPEVLEEIPPALRQAADETVDWFVRFLGVSS